MNSANAIIKEMNIKSLGLFISNSSLLIKLLIFKFIISHPQLKSEILSIFKRKNIIELITTTNIIKIFDDIKKIAFIFLSFKAKKNKTK
jgi:hypothetical protein